MNRRKLIVFTRYPEPGHTKTRLIPALGARGAADLHRRMTEHTVEIARAVRVCDKVEVEVCFTGSDQTKMRQWLGPGLDYHLQVGNDLGERMAEAFQRVFDDGCEQVVLIGSDCPELNAERLVRAFALLDGHEVVIGPTYDGGYCLIGTTRMVRPLFAGIPWGTDSVLKRTLGVLYLSGLRWTLLDPLTDVDTAQDLSAWERIAGMPSKEALSISVVIPTLNEAATIESAIHSARGGHPLEIIVADGGSDDGTVDRARRFANAVLSCQRGRSCQMNAGAEVAQGDCLLFLHADTILPDGYERHVRDILSEVRNACGAFALRIKGDFRGRRCVEAMANFRSRWRAMPYGDQGLFVRRGDFRRLAGFKDMAIMEDYDFVRRVRRLGRIVIAPASVSTSDRRWQRLGALGTTAINQMMIAGYRVGISPRKLAEYYRRQR